MRALDNVRLRVSGALAPAISRVEAQLDTLSPRDRNLLFGMIAVAITALVGLGAWSMDRALNSLESEIVAQKETLAFVESAAADWKDAQVQLDSIEAELKKHGSTDLSAFLEKAAQSAAIKDNLDSVRETSVTTIGNLEQKNYSVSVSKVTLDQFLNFLYEAEATGYPLRITSTNIKAKKRKEELQITAKLEVAAFKLIEDETVEEG